MNILGEITIARHTKVSEDAKEKIISMIIQGKSDKEICKKIKICRTTLYKIKLSPEFIARTNKAKEAITKIAKDRTQKVIERTREALDTVNEINQRSLSIIKKFLAGEKVDKTRVAVAMKFFGMENFWKSPGLEVLLETLDETKEKKDETKG